MLLPQLRVSVIPVYRGFSAVASDLGIEVLALAENQAINDLGFLVWECCKGVAARHRENPSEAVQLSLDIAARGFEITITRPPI